MRLLLDTHILLAVIANRTNDFATGIRHLLDEPTNQLYASVASLWEIAIKYRLGKLQIPVKLDVLAALFIDLGIELVSINERHAVALVEPEPLTRDPFDRMLLAQCEVENFWLVTIDRALSKHRLAVKAP